MNRILSAGIFSAAALAVASGAAAQPSLKLQKSTEMSDQWRVNPNFAQQKDIDFVNPVVREPVDVVSGSVSYKIDDRTKIFVAGKKAKEPKDFLRPDDHGKWLKGNTFGSVGITFKFN